VPKADIGQCRVDIRFTYKKQTSLPEFQLRHNLCHNPPRLIFAEQTAREAAGGHPVLDLHQTHRTKCHALLFVRGQVERKAMTRLIALAFALTLTSLAQAMPLAPLHQPDGTVVQVREACGAGMHMVNGTCVRTHARRAASRCARGVTC
jgi:hypothetical protein